MSWFAVAAVLLLLPSGEGVLRYISHINHTLQMSLCYGMILFANSELDTFPVILLGYLPFCMAPTM